MNDELIPCPFCGGKSFVNDDLGGNLWSVECEECGADGGIWQDREYAIKKWNTRVEKKTCVMKIIKSGPLYDVFQCTYCGTEFAERNSEVYIDYKYCPVCGAKVVE